MLICKHSDAAKNNQSALPDVCLFTRALHHLDSSVETFDWCIGWPMFVSSGSDSWFIKPVMRNRTAHKRKLEHWPINTPLLWLWSRFWHETLTRVDLFLSLVAALSRPSYFPLSRPPRKKTRFSWVLSVRLSQSHSPSWMRWIHAVFFFFFIIIIILWRHSTLY